MIEKTGRLSTRRTGTLIEQSLENAVSRSYDDSWPYDSFLSLLITSLKAEDNVENIYTEFLKDLEKEVGKTAIQEV